MSGLRAALPRWRDLRPLDAIRSIKVKLGVLVATSVTASALLSWLALVVLQWPLRWTIVLAVGVSLLVTQVLARGTTSPLRQMTAAARAMAAGQPAPPVATSSRDEVGELARAFTGMAAELAGADAQRRELLADVAHELRTPVAALRAQLENAVDGVRPADPAALAEMLGQAEQLGVLVDDLLDLARAEAGVVSLHRSPVSVGPLVAGVADQVALARPGQRVVLDVPDGLVVDADPGRLRQVVVNLVDNAVRYSPRGGRVDVTARPDGSGGLVMHVADQGRGIPEEHRQAVFQRFRRASAGHAEVGGGSGLGLAIARWAVELHGGRIAVVPAPRGCLVRVELPAAPTAARRPVRTEPSNDVSDSDVSDSDVSDAAKETAPVSDASTPSPESPPEPPAASDPPVPSNPPTPPPAPSPERQGPPAPGWAGGPAGAPAPAGPAAGTFAPPPGTAPGVVPGGPPVPAVARPPARPGWFRRVWPGPSGRATVAVPAGVAVAALLGAGTLVGARDGLQLLAVGVALAVVGVLAGRRAPTWRATVPGVLAVLLAAVPAVRDANWLVVLCLLAALGLAALAAVAGTTWPAVFAAIPLLVAGAFRGTWWVARPARPAAADEPGRSGAAPDPSPAAVGGAPAARPAGARQRPSGSWWLGLLVGIPVAGVVTALLASADPVFARVLRELLPQFSATDVVARPLVLVLLALLATGIAFLAAAPPAWDLPRSPARSRTVAGWALPLGLTGVVLALFLAVQGAVLFRRDSALAAGDVTLAEWARAGFWQLLLVVAIGLTLFVVAAVRCDPEQPAHRRLLAGLGGGVVLLLLVVVASALTRMLVYQSAFGWSVDRVNVALAEIWLGVVLVGGFVLWLVRRSALVPRLVVYSAAAGLLTLAVLGPEQFVAEANVDRYEETGDLDVGYLARLSHDAVPAIDRLPEPERSCALGLRQPADDPWFAASLAREQAARVLADHQPVACRGTQVRAGELQR